MEDSARFVYALAKRCRQYYLSVTTITQDVNDFYVHRMARRLNISGLTCEYCRSKFF